jgi:hypothetical protein
MSIRAKIHKTEGKRIMNKTKTKCRIDKDKKVRIMIIF